MAEHNEVNEKIENEEFKFKFKNPFKRRKKYDMTQPDDFNSWKDSPALDRTKNDMKNNTAPRGPVNSKSKRGGSERTDSVDLNKPKKKILKLVMQKV